MSQWTDDVLASLKKKRTGTGADYWAARPLAKCAMKVNGEYIETTVPAYRTLEVSGRHSLEAEIEAYDTAEAGSVYKRRRELSRTLYVRFAVKAATTAALHEALDKVNGLLRAEQMDLTFDDEPSWTYYGTRSRMTIETLLPTFAAGTISIYCADPYKYGTLVSVDAEATTGFGGALTIDYTGTVPAAPIINVTPMGEIGGFTAELNGAQITIGDLVSPDGVPTTKPEVLNRVNFAGESPDTTNWAATSVTSGIVNYTHAGTAAISEGIGLRATDYGSGTEYHGPAWALTIPMDTAGNTGVENFVFSWRAYLAFASLAAGEMAVSMQYWDAASGQYAPAATINIRKGSGSNRFVAYCTANGEYLGNATANVDELTRTIDCTISHADEMYSLTWGGGSKTYKAAVPEPITRVQVIFAAYGTLEPIACRLVSAQLLKSDAADWKDLPNLFPGDTDIAVDTATGKITVNGTERPDVGNLENDYEDFRLVPGDNVITFGTNDWATTWPTYTVRYREVRI